MITRRGVLFALGPCLLLAGLAALAQPQGGARRIGFLGAGSAQASAGWLTAFRGGMAELRWVEGRDYLIDARYPVHAAPEDLADLAAELIATRPDLLLVPGDVAIQALVRRTKTLPIVFAMASDPVASGFARTLRNPGGNVTGLTSLALELADKRLQLLKQAFPRVTNIVLLFEPNEMSLPQVKQTESAAAHLKIRVTPIELRQPGDIEPAFKRGAALGVQAYILASGPLMHGQRRAISDGVLRAKVPGMFESDQWIETGGLMSYGPSYSDNFRRAATYVDKILKGVKPADLPIEQPTKFELVINLKTAKALGLAIPQALLVRADRVIE